MSLRSGDLSVTTVMAAVVLVGVLVSGVAAADAVFASTEDADDPAADVEIDRALQDAEGEVEVIVRFKSVDRAAVQASENAVDTLKTQASASQGPLKRHAARTDGVTVENEFWIANAALVTVDTSQTSIQELGQVEGVEQLHENFEVSGPDNIQTSSVENSTVTNSSSVASGQYKTTYGLDMINATEVWDKFGTKGEGASVAVLDSGVDPDNPDINIEANNWQQFDSTGSPVYTSPNDGRGHGTHVSGTVVGPIETAGTVPSYGVAPEAELYHGKVLDDDGSGSFGQIIAGMEWAVDDTNADIVTMSLSGDGYYSGFIEPSENAREAGVVLVTSAGNRGEGLTGTPGNVYPNFASGAVDKYHNDASFSSGEIVSTSDAYPGAPDYWPDEYTVPNAAAPGVGVLSAMADQNTIEGCQIGAAYCEMSGTSMSAPHKAGAFALMVSASGGAADREQLINAMEETAWKPDYWSEPDDEYDPRYGKGIIDAYAATVEATAGTVEGTIRDNQTGSDIEDATVTIEGVDDGWSNTTQTDDSGAYEFQKVPTFQEYTVTVTAEGYEEATGQISPAQQESVTKDIVLDGNAMITATVTDATEQSQAAVANTTVEIEVTYDGGTSFTTSTTTEANGSFELPAIKGSSTVNLAVDANGYHPNTVESTEVADDVDIDIGTVPLTGDAVLSGTLTDAETSDKLPGVAVTVESGTKIYENTSASDGTYEISVPGTGALHNLSVDPVGYESWERTEVVIDGDETFDIKLSAPAKLSGNVTNYETGTSLSAIPVTVEGPEGTYDSMTTTDGTYSIGLPESGATYDVSIDADGFDSWQETGLQVSNNVTQNAELTGDADVTFTVEDRVSNAPVEVATVELANETIGTYNATSDGAGEVTVSNISSAANYTLAVDAAGYYENEMTLTGLTTGANDEGAVSLAGDAAVQGVVTDAASETPLSGATVTVIYPDGTIETDPVETGDDGSFLVEGIPGNGSEYGIEVTADGYDSVHDTIRAPESETVTFDRPLAGNAVIEGTVTDAISGSGLADASVTVTYPDDTALGPIKADDTGMFHVADVPGTDDDYNVTVESTGYESEFNDSVTVASDATADIEFSLTGGASIDGTVVDAVTDNALTDATVNVTYSDGETTFDPVKTDDSGAFNVKEVPGTNDEYTLNASATGYENATIMVEVGETGAAVGSVELNGNSSIAGTVNSSADLLEGVTITATSGSGASYRAETDTDGSYQVERVPGTGEDYTVEFEKPGFQEGERVIGALTTDETDVNPTLSQKSRYFAVDTLSAPETATVDSSVEVSANVSNLGSTDWTNQSIRLLVNETEHASQNVSLNATDSWRTDENTTVTFIHTPNSPGEVTYEIATANETTNATVTVEESSGGGYYPPPMPSPAESGQPALRIVDHALSATEIETGETVTVETTVENTGDAAGSTTLELTADGETVDDASVDVGAGGSAVVTFEHTISEPGEYELAVDGESVDAVTVVEPEENVGEANEGETEPDDDDGIPGFGVPVAIAALVALASVALATRRRS